MPHPLHGRHHARLHHRDRRALPAGAPGEAHEEMNGIASNVREARSRMYRRRFLQVNIRWKALDEIYKIYMLLQRKLRHFVGVFNVRNAKTFAFFKFRREFRCF